MKSTNLPHINHFEAKEKFDNGAILIDIREAGETAKEYIEGALVWPLSKMPSEKPKKIRPSKEIIFFCRSGNRTAMNDQKLNALLPNKSFILDGGIGAWRGGKLPTVVNKSSFGVNSTTLFAVGFVAILLVLYLF